MGKRLRDWAKAAWKRVWRPRTIVVAGAIVIYRVWLEEPLLRWIRDTVEEEGGGVVSATGRLVLRSPELIPIGVVALVVLGLVIHAYIETRPASEEPATPTVSDTTHKELEAEVLDLVKRQARSLEQLETLTGAGMRFVQEVVDALKAQGVVEQVEGTIRVVEGAAHLTGIATLTASGEVIPAGYRVSCDYAQGKWQLRLHRPAPKSGGFGVTVRHEPTGAATRKSFGVTSEQNPDLEFPDDFETQMMPKTQPWGHYTVKWEVLEAGRPQFTVTGDFDWQPLMGPDSKPLSLPANDDPEHQSASLGLIAKAGTVADPDVVEGVRTGWRAECGRTSAATDTRGDGVTLSVHGKDEELIGIRCVVDGPIQYPHGACRML
jgi:hypothetical protein